MKKLLSILVLSAICALASGCGVKGPLYFPEKEKTQETQ
ncbi:LPS translocon maturation chaperone LptM [Rodentibacter myodis]|nr:lipoprotein [Rodentibacter myodis]